MLLDIPVNTDDGFSQYICDKCKTRVVHLEKSVADLADFKELANKSRSVSERYSGPSKRATGPTRESSPEMSLRSKIPRTLTFDIDCEYSSKDFLY